ncbi:hypothetical protein HYFRA_00004358 [Hymenoscyphus fraxineus]|uniref:Uncharacterized protein n=1 Tax=Hymenoscyphus fraxineus TaxID=746836 RepID=A0A9N9KLQ2_9HELO|nr:hypothetical protein HYFRA_00004358 [Hymenoscyphus fraxineus]
MTYSRFGNLMNVNRPASSSTLDDYQSLGSTIGSCDIRCILDGSTSKWTENDNGIRRLLYFDLEFKEGKHVFLENGTVQIDVGSANREPLPTFREHAPDPAFRGRAIKQHVKKYKEFKPHLEVNVLSIGGGIGGVGSHRRTSLDELHSWSFKAGNPSNDTRNDNRVTKAEFSWRRTLLADQSGLDKTYKGAVVLHRKQNEPITLDVRPYIFPWKWGHRCFHAREGTVKRSDPVGPGSYVDSNEFDKLVARLQADIKERNGMSLDSELLPNMPVAHPSHPVIGEDQPRPQGAMEQDPAKRDRGELALTIVKY